MHIAYDSQIFRMQQNGGISKYFVKLIEAIKSLDNTVEISTVAGITPNDHLLESNIKYHGIPFNSIKRQVLINRFYDLSGIYNSFIEKKYLSNSTIDIIHHTYNGYELFLPKKAKKVITIHDLIYEKFQSQFSDSQDFLIKKKESILNADHIICVSKNTQMDLIKYYSIDISKTSVVHHGVDEYKRQENRIIKENYILYVGKREGYKNFINLLKAYSLSCLNKQIKLICFGGSSFNKEELRLIFESDLSDYVLHMKGSDFDLANLYQNALFFIYPSIYEGFGLPVLEAMANKCPVICSNNSSLPEITNDSALSVNCEDIIDLKHAMEQLYNSADLRDNLVKLGMLNVKKFTWQLTAVKTLRIYKDLLGICNE